MVMQRCILGYVRIRARWIGPYAWRSVRTPFRGCTLSVLQSVRYVIGRPLAAVGGPIYRARIYENTHVMGRGNAYLIMWKHVCGNENVRIWWIGYTYMVMWNVHAVKWRHRFENEKNMYLVMRICVIGYVRIRARWIGPLRLAECSQPISWWTWGIGGVFALYFVGVKKTFSKCSQRVRNLFDIHS